MLKPNLQLFGKGKAPKKAPRFSPSTKKGIAKGKQVRKPSTPHRGKAKKQPSKGNKNKAKPRPNQSPAKKGQSAGSRDAGAKASKTKVDGKDSAKNVANHEKYKQELREAEKLAKKNLVTTKHKIDPNLMTELKNSGVKHNEGDVLMLVKNHEGKLMWLEKGNSSAGLQHIADRHSDELIKKGVEDIPQFLNNMLKSKPVKTGRNKVGPFSEYMVDGKIYIVGYGENGFIVSLYPYS